MFGCFLVKYLNYGEDCFEKVFEFNPKYRFKVIQAPSWT